MNGLRTAFQTLTIIPLPGSARRDFRSSLPWFPLVGLFLGAVLYATAWFWGRLAGSWAEGGGVLLLAGGIILTRGLHLDGLADWADSVGAPPRTESRLSIMKDSRMGAFGGIALFALLLAKWVGLTRLLEIGAPQYLVPALVLSRGMMVEWITTLPYARETEGTAGPFVKGATPRHRILSLGLTGGICLFYGMEGVVLFAVGWVLSYLFRWYFQKGFCGITGDLLGTGCELTEVILIFLAGLSGHGTF
jgi:adenosylcobinamide-GDP ribazoletransferase